MRGHVFIIAGRAGVGKTAFVERIVAFSLRMQVTKFRFLIELERDPVDDDEPDIVPMQVQRAFGSEVSIWDV